MRQVFTSPRLANVEAVAQLLEEAGIETTVRNGRSYKGRFDRGMSYRDTGTAEQAAVWVMRAEDQPRARQMLREAGLLDSTRPDQQRESFLPEHLRTGGATREPTKRWLSPGRLKVMLLLAIAVVMGMVTLWQRRPEPPAPAPTQATASQPRAVVDNTVVTPLRTAAPGVQRVDVPSALAVMLLERAGRERGFERACVQIDDATPVERVQELLADAKDAPKLAECVDGGTLPRIEIDDYRTDGSGEGRVHVRIQHGKRITDQQIDVARSGHEWRVTGSTRP